jgi:Flp pilus assembly pilin Flp
MRRGQTITEYLFLLSLITIGAILALTVFGNGVGFRYANILNRLPFP